MSEGSFSRKAGEVRKTAAAAIAAGEIHQLADGRAAVYNLNTAASSGDRVNLTASGQWVVPKTAGVVILDGGRLWWDHSANEATFRRQSDRDFYLGRAIGDAASSDTTATVELNTDPRYDVDIARDPFDTVLVGSATLLRRGGAHRLSLTSAVEAQKVDLLAKDGFAPGANAIVEGAIEVVDDGSGSAVDLSVGLASATHASDADSIAESVFIHLDAGSTNILAESDDGTTEVAATDTTVDYTEGTRVEFWIDCRDPSDVAIYLDGVRVLSGTTFDISAATGPLYLLAHLEKSSAADTYEVDLDWLRARTQE